jgi:uncharacterized SAM-binding protein YcdF (DUF218 family)
MFFTLSKILWFIVDPGNLFIIVLAAGAVLLWAGKARLGRWLVSLALLGALAVAVFPLGERMTGVLENRFTRPQPMPGNIAGIIVLGGVLNQFIADKRGAGAPKIASGRFAEFIRLARLYPDARLVFTGGSGSLRDPDIKEADFAEPLLKSWGLDTARVLFESRSRNTFENAQFSKALVRPKPQEKWIVITSAFHMPRTMGVFRRAGWNVVPDPVDYRTVGDEALWPPRFEFLGGMNSFSHAVHEWLGLSFYWLTGRTDAFIPAPRGQALTR